MLASPGMIEEVGCALGTGWLPAEVARAQCRPLQAYLNRTVEADADGKGVKT